MKALREKEGGDGEKIAKRALSLESVEAGKSFFVYRSFASEADTSHLIAALLAAGKKVYLPRVEGEEMVAVSYTGDEPMEVNAFGIEEPTGKPYEGEIDVTVLPLLACDNAGRRLGYGGGFYDRFLAEKKTYKLGYCFDYQIVSDLPAQAHDVRLDAVVTDKRALVCGGGKR